MNELLLRFEWMSRNQSWASDYAAIVKAAEELDRMRLERRQLMTIARWYFNPEVADRLTPAQRLDVKRPVRAMLYEEDSE